VKMLTLNRGTTFRDDGRGCFVVTTTEDDVAQQVIAGLKEYVAGVEDIFSAVPGGRGYSTVGYEIKLSYADDTQRDVLRRKIKAVIGDFS